MALVILRVDDLMLNFSWKKDSIYIRAIRRNADFIHNSQCIVRYNHALFCVHVVLSLPAVLCLNRSAI